MLKIAVYDSGMGGKAVADFLSTELKTVEVFNVIGWQDAWNQHDSIETICQRVEDSLLPYIYSVDLIVLGGYVSSLAITYLRENYPDQNFVGMIFDPHPYTHFCRQANEVAVLANRLLLQSPTGIRIRQKINRDDLAIPDCAGWDELIDVGGMSSFILRHELQKTFQLASTPDCYDISPTVPSTTPMNRAYNVMHDCVREFLVMTSISLQPKLALSVPGVGDHFIADDYNNYILTPSELCCLGEGKDPRSMRLVFLLDTHLWNIKEDLEDLFGYNSVVIDFREELLHDVCLALGLRGVDGKLGE